MKRRDLLMGAGAAGLYAALNHRPLSWAVRQASGQDPHHFLVFISVWGAMDVTVGLDPWLHPTLPDENDMYIEYRPEDLIAIGETMKVGPAAGFLTKYKNQFSIVNGVFMAESDVGHETLRDYMVTGNSNQQAAAFAVEASLAFNALDGFGAIVDSSRYPKAGKALATPILDVTQLSYIDQNLADIGRFMHEGDRTPYAQTAMRAGRSVEKLQRFLRLKQELGLQDPLSEGDAIALAFVSGASRFAHIDYEEYDFSMDTHFDHPVNHIRLQIEAWGKVDSIFESFKRMPYNGGTLFDHTTFAVVNEFARTPALNAFKGKDHNPLTNSVLLMGKGIRPGLVVGGSKLVTRSESKTGASYHIGLPVDFATGQAVNERRPDAHMIFPEHVICTLCHSLKMDPLQIAGLSREISPIQALLRG